MASIWLECRWPARRRDRIALLPVADFGLHSKVQLIRSPLGTLLPAAWIHWGGVLCAVVSAEDGRQGLLCLWWWRLDQRFGFFDKGVHVLVLILWLFGKAFDFFQQVYRLGLRVELEMRHGQEHQITC